MSVPVLGEHQCYRDLEGSIPLLLIAVVTLSDDRNAIIRLEASGFFEPATIAAENTAGRWISAGIVPTKSTPGA